MWAKAAGRTLAELDTVDTEAGAFDVLHRYALAIGADLLSYHHIPPPLTHAPEAFTLLATGYPDSWVERYQTERLHRVDPITAYVRYQTRPVLWSSVPDRVTLTPDQQHYMKILFSWLSPGDGLAVPVFGPSGRHGYVGVGRTRPTKPWGAAQVRTIGAICESFHLRFCELRLGGLVQDFELSEREAAILHGMAQGWTDPIIGGAVGLRPDALRAAIHVMLGKMSVADRASAVLRGRGLDLVGGRAAPPEPGED